MIIVIVIFCISGLVVFHPFPAAAALPTPGEWWTALVFFVLSGGTMLSWLFSGGRVDSEPEYSSLDEILRRQKGLDYWSIYDSRKSEPWPGNLYEDSPVLEMTDYIAAAVKTEAAQKNIHLTKEREEYIEAKAAEIAWYKVHGNRR